MGTINFTSEVISADFEENTISFFLPKWQRVEAWRYQIIKL